ncbi:MAG: hypothetical protein ACK5O2_10770 [Microthrixaceae bacterium]
MSSDGQTWTEQAPFGLDQQVYATSITYGAGQFLLNLSSCGASHCGWGGMWMSPDGITWTEDGSTAETMPEGESGGSLGFAGQFGVVGRISDSPPAGSPMFEAPSIPTAALLEGAVWQPVPMQPADLYLRGLSGNGDTWVAVGSVGSVPAGSGVWTSGDLANWTQVGAVDARLTDVSVGSVAAGPITSTPGTGAPSTTAPAGATIELTEEGFRVGREEYPMASTPASTARAALTEALGEPAKATPIGSGACEPGQYRWGELEYIEFSEQYWYFSLNTYDTQGPSVSDRVATDGGVHLGDPVSEFQTAHPATEQIDTDYGGIAYWADSTGDGRGLIAYAPEGTIDYLAGGAFDPTDQGDC